jgi:succinyl-diaminopimelate desuccinylase
MDKKIFDYIDNSERIVIELETELTRRPALSPDSGGNGELEKCEFLEAWLRTHKISCLQRIDIPDGRVKAGIRPNLIATIKGADENAPRLWIMSHLDVVPPGEDKLWHSDPWQVVVRDGKIIGRGVEDNQAGLVSSVIAVLALIENGMTPSRTIKLLFVADEECGSVYGIEALLKLDKESAAPLFHKSDMALIPDGGDSKGATLEIAEKNQIWMKFITKGLQSHGSRPDQGRNAHLAAAALTLTLYEKLTQKFNTEDPLFIPASSTFEPTKKEANVPNINTIPGEDVFYMDMRILPCYSTTLVINEIELIKKEIEQKYDVTVSTEIIQRHESAATNKNCPLVRRLQQKIKEVLDVDAYPVGIGGGTVGAFLRNEGIDSVVWSLMDDTAHQPNEYALIKYILDTAKVMAGMMAGAYCD